MLMKKKRRQSKDIIFRSYNEGENETSGDTHALVLTWYDSAKSLTPSIDSSLRTSSTYTGSLPTISSSTFEIGGEGTGASLYGAMDEFKIHDIAVSSAHVAQRYSTTVPEPSPLAFVAAGTAGIIVYLRHRRRGACCI